jgi:hypothetical protein
MRGGGAAEQASSDDSSVSVMPAKSGHPDLSGLLDSRFRGMTTRGQGRGSAFVAIHMFRPSLGGVAGPIAA